MTSIILHTTSGPDGKLHLEVPVGLADTEFEVQLTARPKSARVILPPGYFDLIGSVDDETLVRQPQGELPPPVKESWSVRTKRRWSDSFTWCRWSCREAWLFLW